MAHIPIRVEAFAQQVHRVFDQQEGLSNQGISRVTIDTKGTLYVLDDAGSVFSSKGTTWTPITDDNTKQTMFISPPRYPGLEAWVGATEDVRDVAKHGDEIAVAAPSGLYLRTHMKWERLLPMHGKVRWAPVDVRAVAYDIQGRLWFASPQGVGCRVHDKKWRLFTGADGLPYNDFTCMSAGQTGVWFGTTNGVIQYHDNQWFFRQGRRWLAGNCVRDVAVDADGNAWIATDLGLSCIANRPMTLAGKSALFEDEIEKHHRRTVFGYVNPADLAVPGNTETSRSVYTDNDGFNTGLYLGAMSFAYTVTGKDKYRNHARKAFQANAFLSEVTQGGEHPAPQGFIARNVIPTTESDPNLLYDKNYDLQRKKMDPLWKIMEPRCPVDKSGKWYWKCDSSSDELDGHFFGYAVYFDRVCEAESEKDEVRIVVQRITDHLIANGYNLVDHDGLPTRWAHFSPDDLNRNPAWHAERGLNSYSILTYLSIAHHITGDAKYREIYLELALDHGYGMNGMTQPKMLEGPNHPGHQPDDNMAFMNYYHLIRYETDPDLLTMYQHAIHNHWQYEKFERNPFTNFIYGACVTGKTRLDQWGEIDLSPPISCFEDGVDTLKRYPIDLIEWPMSNSHRTDMIPLGKQPGVPPKLGARVDGYAFPIDERHETYWDWDPWMLEADGDGTRLRPGFHYLLAYYLGLFHEFFLEELPRP